MFIWWMKAESLEKESHKKSPSSKAITMADTSNVEVTEKDNQLPAILSTLRLWKECY